MGFLDDSTRMPIPPITDDHGLSDHLDSQNLLDFASVNSKRGAIITSKSSRPISRRSSRPPPKAYRYVHLHRTYQENQAN